MAKKLHVEVDVLNQDALDTDVAALPDGAASAVQTAIDIADLADANPGDHVLEYPTVVKVKLGPISLRVPLTVKLKIVE